MLEYQSFGDGDPLVIVHGLYGSGRNWGVIAKRLADQRRVVTVDMRNHGVSPWFKTHSYPELAQDLAELLEHLGPADVVGHSMGGKASMVAALNFPHLINRLIVADIAPVAYGHSQMQFIKAMRRVDFSKVKKRSDALPMLGDIDPGVATFLLQSIDIAEKKWRLNLDTLEAEMPKILGFPEVSGQFDGATLFLSGATSDYVRPEHRDRIKALFPKVYFAKIPGAGHWLHAEKPREFEAAARAFLQRET